VTTTIDPARMAQELLATAAELLSDRRGGPTTAGRRRGASLALRTALEIAVGSTLDAAVPRLADTTMRAKMLCLRSYAAPDLARRANSLWAHLCLACHYHHYELGPTDTQVRAWHAEVGDLIEAFHRGLPAA